jgi:DNA-binding beta-propeller fold protein YncE
MNRREFVVAAAALPVALRSGRALAGGTPLVLVTADTESRIVAVHAGTGKLLRSIPTLPGPRSIEAVGTTAVVAHTAVGAVTIIDARTLRVRGVLRDFAEPRYTAAHPDGRHAFVTDSAESEVVAVDVVRGRVLGRVRVSEWARHISIDAAGRTLWVGLGTAEPKLAIVDVRDPARPRLVRHVRAGFGAHDVGFLPGGRAVWVTSGDRGAMEVHAAHGREVLVRLPADTPPQHVTFAAGLAYVTSGRSGTLRVHSLRDGRRLHVAPVPVGSYNVSRAWGRIFTPSLDRGTLTVLTERGVPIERVRAAASCHDACFVMSA